MKKLGVIALCILVYAVSYNVGQDEGKKLCIKDTIKVERIDTVYTVGDNIYSNPEDVFLGTPEENLYEVLQFYGIKYPDVAYAIAAQETGWFKSELCVKYNNLFGLYDSKHKHYYHFDNWYESVIAYRDWIERDYNGDEGYLKYLEKLPYSEDKDYIKKIKTLMTQIKGMD